MFSRTEKGTENLYFYFIFPLDGKGRKKVNLKNLLRHLMDLFPNPPHDNDSGDEIEC